MQWMQLQKKCNKCNCRKNVMNATSKKRDKCNCEKNAINATAKEMQ